LTISLLGSSNVFGRRLANVAMIVPWRDAISPILEVSGSLVQSRHSQPKAQKVTAAMFVDPIGEFSARMGD